MQEMIPLHGIIFLKGVFGVKSRIIEEWKVELQSSLYEVTDYAD